MKITIESTTKIVEFEIGGATVPARIWEGVTEAGIPVHCFVTRICPSIEMPQLTAAMVREFEAALKECAPPSVAIRSIPLRMIL